MERSMDLREMRDGIVAVRKDAEDVRLLPWDDQLCTGLCPRCAGLLVHEWCYDLANEGAHKAVVFRCVQCGYRIDPVILKNQRRSTIDHLHLGDKLHVCNVR